VPHRLLTVENDRNSEAGGFEESVTSLMSRIFCVSMFEMRGPFGLSLGVV
jgi:hypothetical protein